VLLLGPRQTGKTTLLKELKPDLALSLISPRERARYERDPSTLADEVRALVSSKKLPLVIVDEVQKVPALMDVAQELLDQRECRLILTGSSARKLRRGQTLNLLPGRLYSLRLDPLSLEEDPASLNTKRLSEHLFYGSLPGIRKLASIEDKNELLQSYVDSYLQEEVREEALVRNVAQFSRFLELACLESGKIVNFSSISKEIGNVSSHTVQNYFEILVDCLVAERVEPITQSATRKKLTKACRYLIFDLGVRRLGARAGIETHPDRLGPLFEQWIGLELIRWLRVHSPQSRLTFWRDPDGPEVDWIVQSQGLWLPIEVKWKDRPIARDAKHLEVFMDEYPLAKQGLIVCRAERPLRISPRVTAVPWQGLPLFLKSALKKGLRTF